MHKDDKDYEFIIPKPCGNIALYQVTESQGPAAASARLQSRRHAGQGNVNDLITVDMSGTQNAATMDVEVLRPKGRRVASHAFTPAAPRWQTKFDKPGEYIFRAKAVNADGKVSENPCQARTIINFPPVCKLWTSCLPCEDYVGKPIVFDANGSTDADGQIVKASFEITDETGKVIDSFMKTEKPFIWEKVFTKAGHVRRQRRRLRRYGRAVLQRRSLPDHFRGHPEDGSSSWPKWAACWPAAPTPDISSAAWA